MFTRAKPALFAALAAVVFSAGMLTAPFLIRQPTVTPPTALKEIPNRLGPIPHDIAVVPWDDALENKWGQQSSSFSSRKVLALGGPGLVSIPVAYGPWVQQKPAPQPDPPKGRGYIPLTPERRAQFQVADRARHGDYIARAARNLALPASFDCRTQFPIPTWDQASCGSCYLCSTVRTMTNAGVMAGFGKPDDSYKLAMQYGMDRPRNFGGCDGGNGTEVIAWALQNGWIAEKWVDASGAAHNDYPPYEARSGNDRTAPGAKVWCKDWTWGMVSNTGKPSVQEIKAAMFLHGRLNIALDAGGQFGNGTSTITSLGSSIDHEINMIGWDDNKDGGAFLLENQWGNSWGTNGCRWITYQAATAIVDHFWVSAGTIPPQPTTVAVPNVVGMNWSAAQTALTAAGLVPTSAQASGTVASQFPTAGTQVSAGTYVLCTLTPIPPGPGPGPGPAPSGPVTTAVLTFKDGTQQTLIDKTAQRIPTSITLSDGTVVPVNVTQRTVTSVTLSDGTVVSIGKGTAPKKPAPKKQVQAPVYRAVPIYSAPVYLDPFSAAACANGSCAPSVGAFRRR